MPKLDLNGARLPARAARTTQPLENTYRAVNLYDPKTFKRRSCQIRVGVREDLSMPPCPYTPRAHWHLSTPDDVYLSLSLYTYIYIYTYIYMYMYVYIYIYTLIKCYL